MTRPRQSTSVSCRGPGDALDAIPWMLGFAPTESLVLLCLHGPRSRFGPVIRFDLPAPAEESVVVAEALELLLQRTDCDHALLVAYTDEGSADPLAPLPRQGLLLEARAAFEAADIGVRDAVLARHGRWWSLLCDDPLCCAPEGTPIVRESPSAVELAYRSAGAIPPSSSRASLAETLCRRPDEAVTRELARLDALAGPESDPGLRPDALVAQLHEILAHDAARRAASVHAPLEPAMTALLIFLVQDVAVRDAATEAPPDDELSAAVSLWREVYTACPDARRPQVGALLAVLAWQGGCTALATCACESVLAIDPAHNLARLTATLIANGIRPDPTRPDRPGSRPRTATSRRTARRTNERPVQRNSLRCDWKHPD